MSDTCCVYKCTNKTDNLYGFSRQNPNPPHNMILNCIYPLCDSHHMKSTWLDFVEISAGDTQVWNGGSNDWFKSHIKHISCYDNLGAAFFIVDNSEILVLWRVDKIGVYRRIGDTPHYKCDETYYGEINVNNLRIIDQYTYKPDGRWIYNDVNTYPFILPRDLKNEIMKFL